MDGQFNATRMHLLQEFGANAGCFKTAMDIAFRIRRYSTEYKDILHGDHIAFHTNDFTETDKAATAITETLQLDNNMYR